MKQQQSPFQGWRATWPALVDRLEIWDGRLIYEIRGFGGIDAWTEADIELATRVYPDHSVFLSPDRRYLVVEPAPSDPVHARPTPGWVQGWREGRAADDR